MEIRLRRIGKGRISGNDLFLSITAGMFVAFAFWGTDLVWAPCLFHRITGSSCLTCGMSRSLAAMMEGSILKALTTHPMAPLLFVAASLVLANQGYAWIFRRKVVIRMHLRERRWILISIAALAAVFWIIRFILELC